VRPGTTHQVCHNYSHDPLLFDTLNRLAPKTAPQSEKQTSSRLTVQIALEQPNAAFPLSARTPVPEFFDQAMYRKVVALFGANSPICACGRRQDARYVAEVAFSDYDWLDGRNTRAIADCFLFGELVEEPEAQWRITLERNMTGRRDTIYM
jgi:hypothetical protein